MLLYPGNLTDADIPAFKAWMVLWMENGHPLQLLPSVAAVAKLKGFEEGVHFEIVKPIPAAAGAEIIFITDHDAVKSPGDWG